MTPVHLNAEQLDQARRAVLQGLARDLEASAALVRSLADELYPSPVDVADARLSLGLLLQSLSTVDALGWPVPEEAGDGA